MKVKEGILVHASKILDPEFQVVNQNKSKVMMPASFLNNQSAGTVQECMGRGLLTDSRGDSAEKQLGSRLDVREFNHGPIW